MHDHHPRYQTVLNFGFSVISHPKPHPVTRLKSVKPTNDDEYVDDDDDMKSIKSSTRYNIVVLCYYLVCLITFLFQHHQSPSTAPSHKVQGP